MSEPQYDMSDMDNFYLAQENRAARACLARCREFALSRLNYANGCCNHCSHHAQGQHEDDCPMPELLAEIDAYSPPQRRRSRQTVPTTRRLAVRESDCISWRWTNSSRAAMRNPPSRRITS